MSKKIEQLNETEVRAMPVSKFDEAKRQFKNFYNDEHDKLLEAEKSFRNLISLLLKEQSFPTPKVVSRLKSCDECIRKFDGKYRKELESSGEEYVIREKITDLIGIRIVCLYESDIPKVEDILVKELNLIDKTDKTKKLEESDSEFGYKGVHLDIGLNSARGKLPEYKRFSSQHFEVQIRTIVQDAWSEVDHKLKYKKATPRDLKRRIFRLAALFELADQEFESIRDKSNDLEKTASKPGVVQKNEYLEFDVLGFLSAVKGFFNGFEFYGETLESLISEIKEAMPEINVESFYKFISENIDEIVKYKNYMVTNNHKMNPYTQIRHCLYLADKKHFGEIIFQSHRTNFDRWLEHGTVHPSEVM